MYRIWHFKESIILFAIIGLAFTAGCSGLSRPETKLAQRNGAQLWAENCASCHNFRSPNSYSDAQWDVAVTHMRVRANLTGAEERAIVEFLKTTD